MAVVFDLGAVVFRWRPEVLLSNVLPHRAPTPAQAGPLVDAVFQAYTGDWGEFDRGTVDVPELVRRMSTRTGLAPEEVERIVAAVPQELQPMPSTVALVERLKAEGHALYFLSNMPLPYARHLETAYPFHEWFRDGVFSSRVQLIKPDPAIFALARERLRLDPAQTLFIDDSPKNVSAAREAGWTALQFTDAQVLEVDLVAGGWLSA